MADFLDSEAEESDVSLFLRFFIKKKTLLISILMKKCLKKSIEGFKLCFSNKKLFEKLKNGEMENTTLFYFFLNDNKNKDGFIY